MSALQAWYRELREAGGSEGEAIDEIARRLGETPAEARRILVTVGRVKLGSAAGKRVSGGDRGRGDKGRSGVDNPGARRRAQAHEAHRSEDLDVSTDRSTIH
jgi:hypothetical protein